MIVVSYSDFFENPLKFKESASLYGIKVLPQKKAKKVSPRVQKKLDALNAVVGIIPENVDAEGLLKERKLEK